jgi:hypothetical protein
MCRVTRMHAYVTSWAQEGACPHCSAPEHCLSNAWTSLSPPTDHAYSLHILLLVTTADFCIQTSNDSKHCLAVCSADPFANISQGMRGNVSVMATLKFTHILFKGECLVRNNRETPLIRDTFISYGRQNIYVRSPLYPRSDRHFNQGKIMHCIAMYATCIRSYLIIECVALGSRS